MNEIIFAVALVGGIGLIVGIVLSAASEAFAVPVDEKAHAIREKLPGANCGACGFSGCDGYAEALSKGEAQPGLCSPGGEETALELAELLGGEGSGFVRKSAVVHCFGTENVTKKAAAYQGIKTCKAAMQLYGGMGRCVYGCIGFGDCAAVCSYGAITVSGGAAAVDPQRCKACGACVSACPHGLIKIEPVRPHAAVLCSSCDKGSVTTKVCKSGCIGCMRCTRACENGAITVKDNHARVDTEKCTACGRCVEACPRGILHMVGENPAE